MTTEMEQLDVALNEVQVMLAYRLGWLVDVDGKPAEFDPDAIEALIARFRALLDRMRELVVRPSPFRPKVVGS